MSQVNFQEMEARLDRIEDFVLGVLKKENPEAYAKFLNQQKINEEK